MSTDHNYDDDGNLVCLDDHKSKCEGEVEWHSTDPGMRPAFPRCARHWSQRLDAREHSIERYADSDVPPEWLDETYAGERWSDDY